MRRSVIPRSGRRGEGRLGKGGIWKRGQLKGGVLDERVGVDQGSWG